MEKLTIDYMIEKGKTSFKYETLYDPEGVAFLRDIDGPITTVHGVYKLEENIQQRVLEMFGCILSRNCTIQFSVSKNVPRGFPLDISFTNKSEDHLWVKIVILGHKNH